jgi:SPP1 family predicted phage head-tail adaptor
MIHAGRLDRVLTIQRPVETQSASGEAQVAWTHVATVWGGRRDVRAREFLGAQQPEAEIESVFTIRWLPDISPKWRVLEGTRTWDITGTAEIGRREGLELRCVAALTAPI